MKAFVVRAALASVASLAQAGVVYSTGFEAPAFSPGSMDGQGSPIYHTSNGSPTIGNAAGVAHTGSQYARMTGTSIPSQGSWTWTDAPVSAAQLAAGGTEIRVSVWLYTRTTGTIGTRMYAAGLDCYDIDVVRLSAMRVAVDGSVTIYNGAIENQLFVSAPGLVSPNQWHRLELIFNFDSHTARYRIDGAEVAVPPGFGVFDSSITTFNDADLWPIRGTTGTLTNLEQRWDDLLVQQQHLSCKNDFNDDTYVDDTDFVLFANAYDILFCNDPDMPAGCPADLNSDGFVDDADFQVFGQAYDALVCP
ncbi:MAG: hypothetical protein ACREJD_04335 [Phycisphaerales bacterium]